MEERKERFETLGGIPLPDVPDSDSLASSGGVDRVGKAGEPPFTRGVHPTMYRSRLWTMRQYAGFATAAATNERFRMLLEQGQTGLSVAFDLPTQLGLDSDDPLSEGEVGKVGVAIDSIADMRTLFAGIPLDEVSTSMTINAPAAVLLALYVAVADEQGADISTLQGTVQNDILKEYIARGTYVFPPAASMRLITDLMAWCSEALPLWNTISISGYHIREAGATAVEELAFTLSNALAYVDAAVKAGLDVDSFAPRLSFFFGCHNDFFEEVAKFRAARRLWHTLMTERYSPTDPRSTMLRFHTQTAGVTLTAQQPLNNIARVSYQGLSAVLGGTQSLHTNSFDEALGLPSDEAVTVALRTQQVLAAETGVADVVDPLGGSWHVEALTNEVERRARLLIEDIEGRGGALRAIEDGFQQRAIHESAWRQQQAVETGTLQVVGVNHALDSGAREGADPQPQTLDREAIADQVARLTEVRRGRDGVMAAETLDRLGEVAAGEGNLMPVILECVRAECTVGEIVAAMRNEFGTWMAPSGF